VTDSICEATAFGRSVEVLGPVLGWPLGWLWVREASAPAYRAHMVSLQFDPTAWVAVLTGNESKGPVNYLHIRSRHGYSVASARGLFRV